MEQFLIQLDDETARQLERAAPAAKRARSAFIRRAIKVALMAEEEKRTEAAYKRAPSVEHEWPLDAEVWDPKPQPPKRKK